MFKHLFTLIWNKKKQNFLLILEIFVSFLVIFAVFTLLISNYRNYRKPMGFDYENVWVVNYNNTFNDAPTDSLVLFYETLKRSIKSLPQVKALSLTTNNIPLSNYTVNGSVGANKRNAKNVNYYNAEEGYIDVLNMKMLEGRWFAKADMALAVQPVVINESLKEELFGDEPALGKIMDNEKKIIGIVQDGKFKGDYETAGKAMFSMVDTGSLHWLGRMVIQVTPGSDAAFEGKLYKVLANGLKNGNVEIEHLVDKRKNINYFRLVPMIILVIVAVFLIVNVAMGLFGVLWYNINKRRSEIGLRRAIGASGQSVSSQLVAEALILATLALIVGCFFAVQFPLLHVFEIDTYWPAIIAAICFIYLLVLICALYPGRQAAKIYPAIALHEE